MTDFQLPETRYAQSGDVSIAYQVMGEGPIDLLIVPGYVSHIEFGHELPGLAGNLAIDGHGAWRRRDGQH